MNKKAIFLTVVTLLLVASNPAQTKDNSLSQEQLDKMSSKDFPASATIQVHDGNLQGEYFFELKLE